jgi:phage tail tape-measure protein
MTEGMAEHKGAIAGGATGAVLGAIAGPLGMAVGAAIGAAAGSLVDGESAAKSNGTTTRSRGKKTST